MLTAGVIRKADDGDRVERLHPIAVFAHGAATSSARSAPVVVAGL